MSNVLMKPTAENYRYNLISINQKIRIEDFVVNYQLLLYRVRFRTFSCGALFRTATAGPVVLISDIFGSFDNLFGVA